MLRPRLIQVILLISTAVRITAFSFSVSNSRLRSNTSLSIRKKTEPVVGYVPDGLTPQQYAKIKKEELAEQKKMNYGAWGPKFASSSRPDGDWMVMSSLWTDGFRSNPTYSNRETSLSNANGSGPRSVARGLVNGFKRYSPIYCVALLLIDMIATTFHIANNRATSSFLSIVFYQIKKKAAVPTVSKGMMLKITVARTLLAALLVPLFSKIIERCNRRLLWSPRRTMTYASLTPGAALLISLLFKIL
jgi:hypothetical protein